LPAEKFAEFAVVAVDPWRLPGALLTGVLKCRSQSLEGCFDLTEAQAEARSMVGRFFWFGFQMA
jgi:hypothetical protein